MNTTSMLAEFITKSRLEDCPEAALAGARRAILDCLGVMLAGSIEPAARILQQVALAEGGLPLATVVGAGRRTRSDPRAPNCVDARPRLYTGKRLANGRTAIQDPQAIARNGSS